MTRRKSAVERWRELPPEMRRRALLVLDVTHSYYYDSCRIARSVLRAAVRTKRVRKP